MGPEGLSEPGGARGDRLIVREARYRDLRAGDLFIVGLQPATILQAWATQATLPVRLRGLGGDGSRGVHPDARVVVIRVVQRAKPSPREEA